MASLLVALTLIPWLAQTWLGQISHKTETEGLLHHLYRKPLKFSLSRPKLILVAGALPVLLVAYAARNLAVEFLPSLDEGAVLLQTIMPAGTSLTESKRVGTKIENWLRNLPGVATVVRRTGHAPGAEDTDNVNHADITVKLVPKSQRTISLEDWIDALKAKTNELPSVQVNYLMPLADKINDALGGVPADLGIDLLGPDLDVLHGFADKLGESIKKISGIVDFRPPADTPVPSLELTIDKAAAGTLGISERSIYDMIGAYSIGLPITSVRGVQKETGVVIHFGKTGDNLDSEALMSLPLRTSSGSSVPIEQVATFGYGEIPSEIYHDHMTRKLVLTANVKGRPVKDVATDIQAAIAQLKMPSGYSWTFSGKYQTEQSALSNLLLVLLLSVVVVAIILWFEFQSIVQVILILLTLPLAAIGGLLALWLMKESINVSSMIGAVMLVGIVVRNGIMLLDYMNRELELGRSVTEAVENAAHKRIRPILMTASVTILGLIPIGVGWGTGSELLRPLAIAVIGGIATSTLLTLLILPAAAGLFLRHRKA